MRHTSQIQRESAQFIDGNWATWSEERETHTHNTTNVISSSLSRLPARRPVSVAPRHTPLLPRPFLPPAEKLGIRERQAQEVSGPLGILRQHVQRLRVAQPVSRGVQAHLTPHGLWSSAPRDSDAAPSLWPLVPMMRPQIGHLRDAPSRGTGKSPAGARRGTKTGEAPGAPQEAHPGIPHRASPSPVAHGLRAPAAGSCTRHVRRIPWPARGRRRYRKSIAQYSLPPLSPFPA